MRPLHPRPALIGVLRALALSSLLEPGAIRGACRVSRRGDDDRRGDQYQSSSDTPTPR
jgi:hypothetical protein